jgi:hypothetical protein
MRESSVGREVYCVPAGRYGGVFDRIQIEDRGSFARRRSIMWTVQKISVKRVLQLGLLAVTGSILAISCGKKAPDAQQANEKRWSNFQKDNKRDMAIGMSAFERRQAQLAAQKKKAPTDKTEATPNAGGSTTPNKPENR